MNGKKVKTIKRMVKKQSKDILLNFFSEMNKTKFKSRLKYCYMIIFKKFPKYPN